MSLASNSVATDGLDGLARVGDSMFYAAETPTNDGAIDQVFAVTQCRFNEDGATVAEKCAWQTLDSDFGEDLSLTNPDDQYGCHQFQ